MDSLIAAAARALAAGDAIGALKHVSLREDPPGRALRGIAMAQLGEHGLARQLLRRAARDFGAHEPLARARCLVAEAEVALAMRDLAGSSRPLEAAAAALEARADHANALHARLIGVRRLLLLGRLGEAETALAALEARELAAPGLPPSLLALAGLAAAEIALRRLRTAAARAALHRAQAAAERMGVPALSAEVAEARSALDRPAARRLQQGRERLLRLDEVEALFATDALIVDACRRGLRRGDAWLPLARRPLLFTLVRALAEGWPGDVGRDALIERAFRTRRPDATHRARLRVEIGRLRPLIAPWARIEASARGYALVLPSRPEARVRRDSHSASSTPASTAAVVVLVPPMEGEAASLQALMADGVAWSTSALALALGAGQRTVQRALAELEARGRVRRVGRARALRWVAPPPAGFTTILLLPASLPLA
ncbi:MAG: helix-turn-helix domain-containing protein [Burkholderiales bacterium]|nr:helix-turn-helix domain-containing protein [Burkholderiales bacterium]